jgi:hypothetical protein
MSANRWPTDTELSALLEQAAATKSQALRFDPEAPGGFRVLTAEEDRELIDAIRLPEQRFEEDRAHLTRERDDAERVGDQMGVGTADAHLQALDDEQRRDERSDPHLPTREELDAVDVTRLSEPESRAWEFLDAHRDIADERAQAEAAGDVERVTELDTERDVVSSNYLEATTPEVDDGERER